MRAVQPRIGKFPFKLVLLLYWICYLNYMVCDASIQEQYGFGREIWNRRAYSMFYEKMYTNLNEASLLGLTAEYESLNRTRYFGSGARSSMVQASVLVPVNVPNHAKLLGRCSKSPSEMASAWHTFLEGIPLFQNLPVPLRSVCVLLFNPSTNRTGTASYDLNCLIDAIESYRNSSHPNLPSIDCVIINGEDLQQMKLLHTSAANYAGWTYTNVTTLIYRSTTSEWDKLLKQALFNEKRWRNGYNFPAYAVEARNEMFLLHSEGDCFLSSRKTCRPLGGWSVWATTGDSSWSWNGSKRSFVRKTRKGSMALMVPLTTASFGYAPTPGADSPASAITAALAITQAIQRHALDIELATFFFVGEYHGSIGSARFIQDASWDLACTRFGLEACLELAYKSNLNFTSVDFSNFDIVIALDQVAYLDSPLYFHVDRRIDQPSNSALRFAEGVLASMQVQKSNTSFLYASPATTYVDFLETNNALGAVNKTVLTLSRFDAFYVNPHVFTSSDVASANPRLSVESIIQASNAVLRVMLRDRTDVKVDVELLGKLWHCFSVDFGCDYLNVGPNLSSTPDYTTRLFTGLYHDVTVMAAAALSKIELHPAYAVAISPKIQIGKEWGPQWQQNESFSRFRGPRYPLLVGSLMPGTNGARTVVLTSDSVGFFTLIIATLFCAIVLFAVFQL